MQLRITLLFLLLNFQLSAQGVIRKITSRPEDIIWSKTYVRSIDLKEEINSVYYASNDILDTNKCLFDIIKAGIFSKSIKALSCNLFTYQIENELNQEKIHNILIKENEINYSEVDSLTGNEVETRIIYKDTLNSESIVQYWIREEWFLDKQRSVLDSRITAICPVRFDSEKQALQPLFWIDFDESANFLNKTKVINRKRYDEVLSFYQLLLKRRFYSQIKYKEGISNNSDFENEVEAIMNSEKLKTELINFECDLWQW